jgi:hypothetical protein
MELNIYLKLTPTKHLTHCCITDYIIYINIDFNVKLETSGKTGINIQKHKCMNVPLKNYQQPFWPQDHKTIISLHRMGQNEDCLDPVNFKTM